MRRRAGAQGRGRPRDRRPPTERPARTSAHTIPAPPAPPGAAGRARPPPPPGDRAGAAVIGSAPPPPRSPPPIGKPDKCRVPWHNSRIQTYYLANGLPSCGSATPCRLPLPHCPRWSLRPPSLSRRGSARAPDNWRERGSEASRASLFCLEGHIENAPGFASCENSPRGRGRFTVERHYPPGSCPDYTGRKGLF